MFRLFKSLDELLRGTRTRDLAITPEGLSLPLRTFLPLVVGLRAAYRVFIGPILAFFTLSTTSYPFMVILNVIFLAVSGLVGVGFLLKAIRQLTAGATAIDPSRVPSGATDEGPGVILGVWIVIYGAVGVQMAWLLRPFIGQPSANFTLFRPRMDNFVSGLWENLHRLTG